MAVQPAGRLEGRYAHLSDVDGAAAASYQEGRAYDSVCFGPSTTSIERNSVLLIPDLVSPIECKALIDDVEHHYSQHQHQDHDDREWSLSMFGDAPTTGFTRHRIPMLSEATGVLYERIMRERLLPFVARELPHLESYLWSRSESVCLQPGSGFLPPDRPAPGTPLSALAYKFSPQEPAVNRYTQGGHFPPHTDQQALTLNVLLQSGETFQGGGTAFWSESADPSHIQGNELDRGKPVFSLHPRSGVGVVFNGTVQHAGQPVTGEGVRYVLVSSFSITNPEYVSGSTKKARRVWISNGSC